jgi:hypothetical protein
MKEYFKVSAVLVLFLLGCVGLLMFVRNFHKQPSLILTSTECNPPCWYGITPGQSTASQVYSALDRIEGVDKDLILETNNIDGKPTKITWYFKKPVEDGVGSVRIQNDLVTAISITTVNSLEMADLFSKLGEPEEYWSEAAHGEARDYRDILLLYPTEGYAVEAVIDIKNGEDHVEIKANTPVFRVTYYSHEMFQELFGARRSKDGSSSESSTLRPWTGFGQISLK